MEITKERPLAPAPLPVLAGVVVLVSLLLYAVAMKIENDWVAVFGCMGVLALASVALDRAGRTEAEKDPHPLWYDQRLPTEKSVAKNVVVLTVLLVLTFVAIQTATPDDFGNPLPYFLAAGFLYLVMPQLLARRMRKRYDRQAESPA